jgi:hypothetical protein
LLLFESIQTRDVNRLPADRLRPDYIPWWPVNTCQNNNNKKKNCEGGPKITVQKLKSVTECHRKSSVTLLRKILCIIFAYFHGGCK